MNGYHLQRFKNNQNAIKKPAFSFKSSKSTGSRMLSPKPPVDHQKTVQHRSTGRPKTVWGNTTNGNNRSPRMYIKENFITPKEGYELAMEPMDCNENWESDQDYWMNDITNNKVDLHPTKNKFPYMYSPRETSAKKENISFVKDTLSYQCKTPTRKQEISFKPLRQSVLNIDNSNGLSFKLEPRKKNISYVTGNSEKRLFPKWGGSSSKLDLKMDSDDKTQSFPRIFTVTVEKLLQWPKFLAGPKAFFELYGILENVSPGKFPSLKMITLKSEKVKVFLTCAYYEIDRPLPVLEKGQWQRCIIVWRINGEYQCLKIRSAMPNELKNFDRKIMNSNKSKALLLKSLNS